MNQFLIHSLRAKSENHYLLIGDIMQGDVSVGDDILLPLDGGLMQPLTVISIEILDQLSERVDYIGLTVLSENISLTENLATIEGRAMQVITAPENQQQ